MARKAAQSETINNSLEPSMVETASLKVKWEQAAKDAQAAYQRVPDIAHRLIEIKQLVRTASSEERKALYLELQTLQLDLEALPYEAGSAIREAVLAMLTYLRAEEQRLIKWWGKLCEEVDAYWVANPESLELPQSYGTEEEEYHQAAHEWEQIVMEKGLSVGFWRWTDWRNETLWPEYASLEQDNRIKVSIRSRDSVLQGK